MATRTFTINEVNCQGGQETDSPSQPTNGGANDVQVTLISSQWDAKAGTGTLRWGIQRSDDGGANFYDWIYQTLNIGDRSKTGGMPALGFSAVDAVGAQGARLRLFVRPSVTIRLGATIAVT